VTDTTARILYVTSATRYDVDVQVIDSLPRSGTDVHTDVKSIGEWKITNNGSSRDLDSLKKRLVLLRGGFKPICNVASRNHESMTRCDWIEIPHTQNPVILVEDSV